MKKVFLSLIMVLLLAGAGIMVTGPLVAATSTSTPVVTPASQSTPIPGVKYVLGATPYRTGPYAHVGSPFANAIADYINLINKKGGVDGYKIILSEIETGYETPRIVEAYERTKGMGTVFAFYPHSTGGVYAVTPKAFKDKIPLHHGGWGISAAAYGKAFPWNFLGAATYWSGDAAIMKYIADKEGGDASLKGKKVAIVYMDVDYGRETIPFHEALTKEFGYELIKFPVPPPSLEQAAVWTDIARRSKPDWVILRMWGMSTPASLREADRVGYPMSRIIGAPWSPTTPDIWAFDKKKAVGVKHWEYANTGTDFPIITEIIRELYEKGEGAGPREFVGIDLYNRMFYLTGMAVSALKLSADKFGHPLDGDKIRWGWENINPEALKWAGVSELAPPVTLSAEDHEGGGWARITEWNGETFVPVSEWLAPYRHIVNTQVKGAAEKFMRENPHLYK